MATLLVAFDHGAVTIGDLLLGLSFCDDVVFLLPSALRTDPLVPLLAAAGRTFELSDDLVADLQGLKLLDPDGILTFSERMLAPTAGIAAGLGLPFHSPETVTGLTDKFRQRSVLARHGVDEVPSRLISSVEDWAAAAPELTLPVVIKPVQGEGSRDTHLVRDLETGLRLVTDLLAAQPEPRRFVIEEYLEGADQWPFGDYVSVETLCRADGYEHIGITGKTPQLQPFRETGQFYPDTLPPELRTAVTGLAERALSALGVRHGITHTEVKITPDGPRIIEVNGRLGGYVNELYLRARGFNLVELVARDALGEELRLPSPGEPDGVYFQYYCQPPPTATKLLAVEGARAVVKQSGIAGRRQLAAPGTELPADSRSFDLDLISGLAPTHAGMLAARTDQLDGLVYTFETPGGPVSLTAPDLLIREDRA